MQHDVVFGVPFHAMFYHWGHDSAWRAVALVEHGIT